jgi:TfoX/Sxy family transcriptional regulator of competence genes
MASSIDMVQYIVDQAGLGRRLEIKKMFGEYALYLDGKVVALICDDELFLKPTPEGKAYLRTVSEAPPYPGARNFYLLASEVDDPVLLSEVLRITASALPNRKIKPRHKAKSKSRAKVAKSRPSPVRSKKGKVPK